MSDNELFSCCQLDNLKAFDEIFNRYFSKLYWIGRKYFDDQGLIEELASDVLLDIWQRRKSIHIEKTFSGFLFKAIHFQCLNHLRKKLPLQVGLEEIGEDRLISMDLTDEKLRYGELTNTYRHILDRLTPQRRKVFELSRERGMTYVEIAEEMKISKNTVELHMSAALKTFRALFKTFLYLCVFFL